MSQRIEAELDDQGRLVISHLLQKQLGLFSGATVIVEDETPESVLLRVHPVHPRVVDKGGVLVVQSEPSGNLEDVVRQERELRLDKIFQPEKL